MSRRRASSTSARVVGPKAEASAADQPSEFGGRGTDIHRSVREPRRSDVVEATKPGDAAQVLRQQPVHDLQREAARHAACVLMVLG